MNTDKIEALLSLTLLVGMFSIFTLYRPMTAESVAKSIEGMPVLTGNFSGKQLEKPKALKKTQIK